MTNPLLDTSQLPRFSEICPEHVGPAIRELIAANRQKLDALLDDPESHDFDSLISPVESMDHCLSRVFSPVSHLQSVLGSLGWREAYKEALPLLTEYATDIAQDARLQRAYRAVQRSLGETPESPERMLVAKALRDFRLAGVDLPDDEKARFKAVMQKLAAMQAAFEHNVQDAADAWSLSISSASELAGLPERAIARAREDAKTNEQDGWLLKLDLPTFLNVMTHADSRDLREAFYRAWSTRASDQGDKDKWDNSDNIEEIMRLRHEAARLVGFDNFAEYSLATKMAASTPEVLHFLRELAHRTRPAAERELAELASFAGFELAVWDVAYWLEKYKQERYSISDEQLRQYFPADRVISGLFALAEKLYGISLIEEQGIATWHETVAYYGVYDEQGEAIGGFYTDLYARSGKRSGAWVDECVNRMRLKGETALPVGYLVCNFPQPDTAGHSLLPHSGVETLFHEFGHMLHHLLTRIDFPSIAGINGVPWDAVELPSQFMENFAWHFSVLERCSGHIETGETLPADLFSRLEHSRQVGAALAMLRQLEFALFDFRLHAEYDPQAGSRALEILGEVRNEIALIHHPDYNRLPHAFSHIFGGGYAAGYYSYKWAEVLAADAFGAFEEAGIFDAATAGRFRREILEIGGSRDIMQAYIAFRGRKPEIDALLRLNGIEA